MPDSRDIVCRRPGPGQRVDKATDGGLGIILPSRGRSRCSSARVFAGACPRVRSPSRESPPEACEATSRPYRTPIKPSNSFADDETFRLGTAIPHEQASPEVHDGRRYRRRATRAGARGRRRSSRRTLLSAVDCIQGERRRDGTSGGQLRGREEQARKLGWRCRVRPSSHGDAPRLEGRASGARPQSRSIASEKTSSLSSAFSRASDCTSACSFLATS